MTGSFFSYRGNGMRSISIFRFRVLRQKTRGAAKLGLGSPVAEARNDRSLTVTAQQNQRVTEPRPYCW